MVIVIKSLYEKPFNIRLLNSLIENVLTLGNVVNFYRMLD